MKTLASIFFTSVILISKVAFGQTADDFRSFQSGNWNDVNTWERYDGVSWINPAPVTPNNTNGVIQILNGDTVTVTASVQVDQCTVNAGGQITISGVTLTVQDGPGTDITINGTIYQMGPFYFNGTASGVFNNNSLLLYNHLDNYIPPASSPSTSSVTYLTGSTIRVISATTATTLPRLPASCYDVIWDCPGQTVTTQLFTASTTTNINGDFTINSTGSGNLRLATSSARNLIIAGDFVMNSGSLVLVGGSGAPLFTVNGNSQLNSGSTLIFSTSTGIPTVNINGDITLSTGSTLTVASSTGVPIVSVKGNWSNNGTTFNSGSGANRITFNGTSAQTIGGTASTTFNNITTNNTFGTSPQVTLGINTIIKNNLTMTAGNINLAGFSLTLGTAPATPGSLSHTGSSSSGWMYGGNFIRYFNTVTIANGAVAGLFPMGNSGIDFRPFYVSCPAIAPTTGGTFTLSHTDATTVTNVSFADDFTIVRRHDAFWTCSSSEILGGTFNLRVEGTGFGIIGSVSDLRLTLLGSVVGVPGTNAGTISNPQVNRTGLALAQLSNNFYISSIDAINSPLPIELLSFTGNCISQTVIIKWSTATETNNDFFTVERSIDGINWQIVNTVDGAGSSYSLLNYSISDVSPNNKISYYRLKQTDFDGIFEYSDFIVVETCGNNSSELIIYPNPSSGEFNIEISGFESLNYSLEIYNTLGEKVLHSTNQHSPNSIVDISSQSDGVYYINIKTDDKIITQKIIKN